MKITWKSKKLKKFLKGTGIALCTVSMLGVITFKSYDLYLDSKLKEVAISQ